MVTTAKVLGVLLVFWLLAACNNTQPSQVETKMSTRAIQPVFHPSHEPQKAGAPFSDAVQVDKLFFLSGQIGINHTSRELVPGGVQAETRQALANIKQVLAQHGMGMQDVVKATVILADIEDFEAFNEVYRKYLPHKPARTTFASSGLARNAQVEIEVVAYRSEDSK